MLEFKDSNVFVKCGQGRGYYLSLRSLDGGLRLLANACIYCGYGYTGRAEGCAVPAEGT